MLRRAAPDGASAAARMAAVLGAPTGGWLPPEEEPGELLPLRECEEGAAREVAGERGAVPEHEPWVERGSVGERSWAGPRHVRLEPSRRSAVALVVVAALGALVATAVVLRGQPTEVAVPVVERSGAPLPGASSPADPGGEVVVAVAGTVRRPGLVRLPAGSRVDDALRAAGGLSEGASPGLLNLARRLVDGEQVLVGIAPPPGAPAAAASGLLDLNAATVEDLDALPGIGPVLAQRIVQWRTENGRFASVDQLREVTGIGEAKYEDLQGEVTV